MKNLIICGLITLAIILMNCHKADNITDCGCDGKTYEVLNNARGTIDSIGDGSISIFLTDRPYTAVSPCTLPDSLIDKFSSDSLKVLISGEIKGICPNWHLVGEPIVLSKIELDSN